MGKRWGLRVVAAATVAAAVLSGCSERQEANDTLPTATSEPTSTTEELPPLGPESHPVPMEARERTPEGALAFMEYYIGLSTYIGAGSVEPQALLDLSDGCGLCRRIAASYQEDRTAGLTYQGFSYTFEEYALPRLAGDIAEIGFVYSQSAYTIHDAQGRQTPDGSVEATGDLQSGAFLEWQSERVGWVVTSLTIG